MRSMESLLMTRTKLIAILLSLAMIACNAHADGREGGWRIGGSAVTSQLKRDDGLIDDSRLGFKIFGQYKFNQWFGLEGAYYNSAEFSSDATSAGGANFELLYEGFLGQALLYVPLPWESLEFFLKGGYFTFDVDSKIDGVNTGKGSDNGAVVGTGLSIHVIEKLHFRTSFDWYDSDGAELWTVELGLAYLF